MQNTTSSTSASGASSEMIFRGLGVGLTPAAFLYVGAVAAYLLTSLVRVVTTGLGFLTQLPIVNVAITICLLLLAVGYVFVAVWAFRQAKAWREAGEPTAATATLWGLDVSALLVLVPVLVAILLPQHPATIV
jgi:hypothetical protein